MRIIILMGCAVLLFLGSLVFGVYHIRTLNRADVEWRQANEARLVKYLGETVMIGGVPHTIISVRAYTWNRTCGLQARANGKETELSEAAVVALLAKAGKVE